MLGQQVGATEFAGILNRFYAMANDVLLAHDAVIDKLVGDEVMALFIPAIAGPEYRRRAVEAGRALVRRVGRAGPGLADLPLGAAVHAGPAFVGVIGSGDVLDFTALGDTVNTASRLQSAASPGDLVLSETVYQAVAARYPNLEAQTIELRGRTGPFTIRVLHPADLSG